MTAKERLEAWKKSRELQKAKEGKASSSTPEPTDKKPSFNAISAASGESEFQDIITSLNKLAPAPLAKTAAITMGAVSRFGLPLKAGATAPKRAFSALGDDDDESDRKLQKLDLPDIKDVKMEMEPQTGDAVAADDIGADLAVEEDVKPETEEEEKQDKMDIDSKPGAATNQPVEDEEDELDAFMRQNNQEVREVNTKDAKRLGLMNLEDESDDEAEVVDKAGDELAKAEALLQYVASVCPVRRADRYRQAAQKSRKKDLPTPDHAKIAYEPFRKAFYSAPLEALAMTPTEAENVRLLLDGIKVRGKDCPNPVTNWGAYGLPTLCLDIIRQNGWTAPTAIQAQTIPAIMSGRDVIGIAKTGSGKTVAFLLPLLRHVKDQRPVSGSEGPIGVILSPTRELAMQIYRHAKQFALPLGVRISCCVGGQSISEDIAAMKKGAEIVVCTPGRMIDLLTANNGRVSNLRRTTFLIMDEADRMFDMGFEPQVMKIINNTRPTAQKVLFSATFPKTMEGLARKILVDPLEITVGGRSVVAPEIDQRVEVRDSDTKWPRLLEILGERNISDVEGEDSRVLIFVDRQEAADDLAALLNSRSYPASSLHGGREQIDRDAAIRNFKSGDIPHVVATSVAARGLDVKELRLVINYDAPNHMEDYVHRAGRTGRAGNKGVCITFITPEQDKFSVDIVRALEASTAFVPPDLKAMSDKFLAKIKAGQAKAASSGFRGKGLERIEKKREEKDRSEKHTYGDTSEALSLSSREGAVIPYKAKETFIKPPENTMKGESDYTFTEIHVDIVDGPAPDRATNPLLYSASGGGNLMKNPQALPAQMTAALEKARREGRMVDASRLSSVIAALRDKIEKSTELTKADKFGLAALEMSSTGKKPKDPDATDFHAIFPINDYPQKARWKVTNKEQMTLLVEHSNASITMRGNYYPPGEEPVFGGEPKLHLLIESNDREKVQAAIDDIRRNLVEASMAALNNADRAVQGGTGGRYAL